MSTLKFKHTCGSQRTVCRISLTQMFHPAKALGENKNSSYCFQNYRNKYKELGLSKLSDTNL